MKKLFILFIIVSLSACNKSDDDSQEMDESFVPPIGTIRIQDSQMTPVDNGLVYVFKAQNWNTNGNDPDFADLTGTTNAQGDAIISVDIPGLYSGSTTERIYFSIHYSINQEEKTQFVSLVFTEGEEKSATITLPFIIVP